MNKHIKILVSGRVQGVGYRACVAQKANSLGLFGYVKNLADGRVEIVAEGDKNKLCKLIDFSYRGSFLSKATSVSFDWMPVTCEYQKFIIDKDGKSFLSDQTRAFKNLAKRVVRKIAGEIPKHVVIIPDGNRRWAKEQSKNSWYGHKKGLDRAVELIRYAKDLNIKYLTIWGFSTENWNRDKNEVDNLMKIFRMAFKKFEKELIENKTSFHHFGRKDRLPKDIVASLTRLEDKTKLFRNNHLALCLDYGGRDELTRAFNELASSGKDISEAEINKVLDSKDFPDVDLVIRTSGEHRTSGIMPWQTTYSELYFSSLHFPDFDKEEFVSALEEYSRRLRRFGC